MAYLTHSRRAGREGCGLCYGTTAPSSPPSQSLVQNRALECWEDAANHGPNPGVTEQSPVTEWSLHREQGSLWSDRKGRLGLPEGSEKISES